jgi:hypothetical protein
MMVRHVHGLLGLPTAVWKGALPDPVGVEVYLRSVLYREQPERWFTPVSGDSYRAPFRFRLANGYIVWMSRLCGVRCAAPEPLPLDQAVVLARWAADAIRRHGGCQIVSSPSLGMRVCLAAQDAGIDLTGAHFFGGGEPMTAAKQATFAKVGARHLTFYTSVDAGPMGLPCTKPIEDNDQHLLEDNLALIQHPREVAASGVEVNAFYFTSLQNKASKILLNMESDDYGIVEQRACGCPLEDLGYHRHVRQIRSFGKLTGEGVTLVGSEMVRILEEVLPQRFGGSPQDFQLVEEHDDKGFTRLTLLVDPSLDVPRDEDLIDGLLEAIQESSVAGGLTQSYWRQAETFRVKRQAPIWTARGKLPSIRLGGS